MLRPYKGEGERPKHNKAPQITLAVLLTAYPICLAEQANASGTQAAFLSSYADSTPAWQRLPLPQRTELTSQRTSPLGTNPSLLQSRFPFVSPKSSTPEEYQEQVRLATVALNKAKSALKTAVDRRNKAQTALDASQTALNRATASLDTLKTSTSTQEATLAQAKAALDTATIRLTSAKERLQSADDLMTTQTSITQSAQAALATAQANLSTASANLQSAQSVFNSAYSTLQSAQYAYDTSSIPNPNYVAPTITTQPTTYQVPDANFQTGEPWVGDGNNNGQPQIHPGHIHFSYVATEVYQDILIAPRAIGNYTFTVSVYNSDTNTINYTGQTPDQYGLGIIFYDANDNVIHQDSFLSTEVHSWRDATLQGTNPNSSTPVAKVRIVVAGHDRGFWSGTYGPAMQNVRLTLGWITGATQAATTTATMPVDIGEGGEATFVAPNSGTFISSNLRYESYNNPSCGADVTPQGLGSNVIQLVADNSVYGDTCGGEVKHLVGTLTYSTAEPQFIKNPTLYTALQTAQSDFDAAQSALQSAQVSVQQAQAAVNNSQPYVTESQTGLLSSQASRDAAQSAVTSAQSEYDSAQAAYATEQTKFASASTELKTAEASVSIAQTNFSTATNAFSSASSSVAQATADIEVAQKELDSIPEPTPTPTPTPTPVPEAPEIPTVDPKTLTTEEVAELVTEAEAVLETAEQGSPQYEQALEALAVAAEADDPEISAELAAIPLLGDAAGAALEVLNNLGNVGADMAPAVREEAEKTVIASVIATGAAVNAVQAAAGAAASAATTASTSTSGSSSGGGGGGASGSSDSKTTSRRKSD